MPAGTPPPPLRGPDSPPVLPTAWATMKHRLDPEVRGCSRGAGEVGGCGCHLGPDSFPLSQRSSCHGLPPTPKVHVSVCPAAPLPTALPAAPRLLLSLVSPQMGACFSKVFNGCPLRIHAAVTWIHPVTRGRPGAGWKQGPGSIQLGPLTSDPIPNPADQFLVVGAEEGIYTLNLHELHEDTLEKVRPSWPWGGRGPRGTSGADRPVPLWPPADLAPLRLALLCE